MCGKDKPNKYLFQRPHRVLSFDLKYAKKIDFTKMAFFHLVYTL